MFNVEKSGIPGLKERVEEMREKVTEGVPRRRLPIVVGALVLSLIVISAFFVIAYFVYFKPKWAEEKLFEDERAKLINTINYVFSGPLIEVAEKQTLLQEAKVAKSRSDLAIIEGKLKASGLKAWKAQKTKEVLENLDPTGRVSIEAEKQVGVYSKEEAFVYIQSFTMVSPLVEMKVGKPDLVSVPIILDRLPAAAGVLHTNDIVDIFVSTKEGVKPLTTGARVIAIFRDKASGEITLTETERKFQTGGGVEGKGTTESLVIGATSATLTGAFAGTKYTTSVEEILKAAAADKVSRAYAMNVLAGYGKTLGTLERVANIAEFNAKYMILLEVPRAQAPSVIASMKELVLTIPSSRAPAWMSSVS